MREQPIVITKPDASRLRALLNARLDSSARDQGHLEELTLELERALVLEPDEVPAEVITMHARVRVLDLANSERREFELVFPSDADVPAGRISVLAPLGTALLGQRQGDEVQWEMPGGMRRLRIEHVEGGAR